MCFFHKSFTDVCEFQCVQEGAMTDLSVVCINLVWHVQQHFGIPGGMPMEAGKCSAKAQTLQLPAQRIQSTAVWLRERQIGRAPQPATEVSWDICFSCKLAYVRDVIRGLKLKPKVNAQFLEQSSSIPVLSFNTASCRLLGHKRNFLRAEKSEASASKILEGNLF